MSETERQILAPELEATIVDALGKLEAAAAEAKLNDDPIRIHLLALSAFLTALRRLFVDGALKIAQEIRDAREPVRDDELRRAVTRGIVAAARDIVQTMRLWAYLAGAGVLFAVLMAGAAGGYLFHGANPALGVVRAGPDQCQDRADGSRICWLPVIERQASAGR